MATQRFHWLDQVTMGALKDVRAAAEEATGSLLTDKVRLGTVHTTPSEQLRFFLSLPPQARDQMREQLGEEAYMGWAQQQMATLAKKKDVGFDGAVALFDMLGIFQPSRLAGVEPSELTAAVEEEDSDEEEMEEIAELDDSAEPELVI